MGHFNIMRNLVSSPSKQSSQRAQRSPSLPASHTPSSLDPLKLYIVLTGDVEEFYLFLSCVAVFTQGKLQSPKKMYTLTMEEEDEESCCTISSVSLGVKNVHVKV